MVLPMRHQRSLSRWDPFAGFEVFNDLFDQMSRMLTSAYPDVARINVNAWSPPVAVHETAEAYEIEADMPGVAPEGVAVDLQGRELRIIGSYGQTARSDGGDGSAGPAAGEGGSDGEGQPQPRRSGRFDYRVTLPAEVDSAGCSAQLEQGVLRLRLPKPASAAPQRIPVQGARPQEMTGGQNTSMTTG